MTGDLSPDTSVAVRLARLNLPRTGELRRRLLVDSALCGAVLIDLMFAGRADVEQGHLYAAGDPTGFGPADDVLAEIKAAPVRSVSWWLSSGAPGEREIADYLVAEGLWEQQAPASRRSPGRYRDLADPRGDAAEAERNNPRQVLVAADPGPPSAALACIVAALGLGTPARRPPDSAIARCGYGEPMVRAVVDYLASARDTFAHRSERPLQGPVSRALTATRVWLEDRRYRWGD
jgi:hypothetical protein